jgi:ribonuclease P protein component
VKRIYSLKGRKPFKNVFVKGKKVQGTKIAIYALEDRNRENNTISDTINNASNSGIKIGITLHRKFGNAIIRNRAKRRVRNICNDLITQMKEGYNIVIRLEQGFDLIPYQEEHRIIKELLQRCGVIQ